MELLVVELHDRLRKSALLVVALDKLRAPRRVSAYVHQLVPVVAVATNEKKSFLVDLGLDLIEGKPRIAVSASPHGCLRRRFRPFADCLGSDGRRGNSELTLFEQLAGKSARGISFLILTREILFSLVWIVRLRFSSHSSQMHDSAIRTRHSLHHANSRHMRVSCVDLIFHGDLPSTSQGIVACNT
jgi:hypothetical protein